MFRSQIATSRTEVVSDRGVVSCGHMQEAEAGARILEEGGNAVDAVVAAAFTGHVVEPASCGLGGYGHMALFLADTRQFVSVDHYVRAPTAARSDMFEIDTSQPTTYYGWPRTVDRQNESGALSVAVPGAISGLCAAHERWGSMPLAQVLEPAIEAAEAGVRITWDLILTIAGRLREIETLPNAAALLLREGRPPKMPYDGGLPYGPDERIDTSQLAMTLREIARQGAAGFYTGRIAEAIVREVQQGGGIDSRGPCVLPAEDHRRTRSLLSRVRYSTASDPIGYEALNILYRFDLASYGPESSEYGRLMAEAMGPHSSTTCTTTPTRTSARARSTGSPASTSPPPARTRSALTRPRNGLSGRPIRGPTNTKSRSLRSSLRVHRRPVLPGQARWWPRTKTATSWR